MNLLIVLFAHIWKHRFRLIFPVVFLPSVAVIWSLSQVVVYESIATIGIDKSKTTSPLLEDLGSPENQEILFRFFQNEDLVRDTLYETGGLIEGALPAVESAKVSSALKSLKVEVASPERIRLRYIGVSEKSSLRFLEKLSLNFVQEILAPERLRLEQTLFSLGEQIQYYTEQEHLISAAHQKTKAAMDAGIKDDKLLKEIVRLEFEKERASAQHQLAQKEYDHLLSISKSLMRSMDDLSPSGALWFVEEPVLTRGEKTVEYYISLIKCMALIGFLISILWILYVKISDNTLKTDEQIREVLGLKIIGRVPHLGQLHMQDGHLDVRFK